MFAPVLSDRTLYFMRASLASAGGRVAGTSGGGLWLLAALGAFAVLRRGGRVGSKRLGRHEVRQSKSSKKILEEHVKKVWV